MNTAVKARYTGVFPVVPTTFTEQGELDLDSQKRCVDFMIDAGSNGLAILANYSEQFVLSDAEREVLTRAIIEHVKGRVPVIVTTTHFSSLVCAKRSRQAQDMGAAMVMAMPPYHGATIRVPEEKTYEFFAALPSAIGIPIMIQDAVPARRCRRRSWRGWRRRSSTSRTSRSRRPAPHPSCASSYAWAAPRSRGRGTARKGSHWAPISMPAPPAR
jgi:dihydrodipicolinate synthase/N-acetylneuraminate lyase